MGVIAPGWGLETPETTLPRASTFDPRNSEIAQVQKLLLLQLRDIWLVTLLPGQSLKPYRIHETLRTLPLLQHPVVVCDAETI